jgi:amidophosphoribosyltransferase
LILKKKLKKFNSDKLREECGVFGISNHADASALVALGLHALQHRGQEGCGIVSFDGKNYHSEKRQGLVGDHFTDPETLKKLPGESAIGHNRYSTTGETSLRNIQPFFADLHMGGLSIAHNGNLTNALVLRESLVKSGAIFRTTSDTETIVQLIAKSQRDKFIDKLIDTLFQIQGGYSLVLMTNKKLVGVRDPLGIRPLVIGKLKNSYIFASETCALDIVDFSVSLIFVSLSNEKIFNKEGSNKNVTNIEIINPNVIIQPKSIIGLIPLNTKDKKAHIVVKTV